MSKHPLVFLNFILLGSPLLATLPDPDITRIKSDLEYLCSDALGGRKTGTEGMAKAATYIAQQFQLMGLQPIKEGGLGGSTVFHQTWNYFNGYATDKNYDHATLTWSLDASSTFWLGGSPTTASQAENVVGVIPGTDPTLKVEYIFVTAHFDHIGIKNGQICPGADDNASGTAGLIEISRLLLNSNPKRSIAILALSGEEQKGLGSEAFLENVPIALSTIKGDINLDMIGRGGPGELHVVPGKEDGYVSSLIQDARELSEQYGIPLSNGIEKYWMQSDNYSFAKKSIPCIWFCTGTHIDQHRPTDTPDKIDYAKLGTVVKIVRDLVLRTANADQSPQILPAYIWSNWQWGPYTTQNLNALIQALDLVAQPFQEP